MACQHFLWQARYIGCILYGMIDIIQIQNTMVFSSIHRMSTKFINIAFIGSIITGCTPTTTNTPTWSGYVYEEDASGLNSMRNPLLRLLDTNGTELTTATAPYTSTPHYLHLEIEESWQANSAILEISNESSYPTIWAGTIPSGVSNSWLSGALFAFNKEFMQDYANSFMGNDFVIDWENTSQLWGQPLRRNEWNSQENDMEIHVYDAEHNEIPVFVFDQTDFGLITTDTSNGITWFFSWNIPAGNILLEVLHNGTSTQTLYPTAGGDIISAQFYALESIP